MSRAAIYTRVSTDEQSASAAAQEDGARAWCAREGHVVVAVYRDEGVSGAEWVNRAGIAALRADANASPRPWDMLVVRDLDRIGRDGIRLPVLLADLADVDVRVVEWSTGQTAPVDTMGRMIASIRSHLAEMEREQIAHRTRTALAQKAARGLVTGGVVYGYRNRRSADGVRYEIHPDEAAVVREIYERASRGESGRVIACALNARGIPSPRAAGGGTGSWCPSTVRAIVRNERYRGEATWGEIGSRYRKGTRVSVVRDDVIRYDVPAIVDAEIWHRAQDTSLRGRAAAGLAPRGGIPPKYLLVGHALCDACGGPIASARTSTGKGATRRVIPAYTCGHARERGVCAARWYRPTERVDAAVLAWLADEALSPDVIHDACERARARSRAVEPDPRVAPLVAEEADLARVVARLTAAIEHGADDVGGVVARLRERSARLAARRAREVLSVGYAERPDLVRAVLGAVLVGRVRVGLRDGRLWLEGEAAPSRLSPDEPGGTRGAETTPTGPARSPGSVDVRVPLRRAV